MTPFLLQSCGLCQQETLQCGHPLGSRRISGRHLQGLCSGHQEVERHSPGRPFLSLPIVRILNRQERGAKHGVPVRAGTFTILTVPTPRSGLPHDLPISRSYQHSPLPRRHAGRTRWGGLPSRRAVREPTAETGKAGPSASPPHHPTSADCSHSGSAAQYPTFPPRAGEGLIIHQPPWKPIPEWACLPLWPQAPKVAKATRNVIDSHVILWRGLD